MDTKSATEIAEYARANLDSMRRTAYLLCGDWPRADDLVQDTLIRPNLLTGRTDLDEPDSMAALVGLR